MQLALTDLFRAKWTNQIHDEWIKNVLKNRPDLTVEKLHRTRDLMNNHVRDCLVENYESLIESIKLPDPDDRHVVAAAIRSGASYIITYNLKDFPNKLLEKYDIFAQHPDEFIFNQLDLNPARVCSAIAAQRANLKNPSMTQDELLDVLLQAGLTTSVAQLRDWKRAF